MFNKILIANRGEIACRIMRTAQRLNIACVAVYSDADKSALHTKLADEAINIGPAPVLESYLNGNAIIDAALKSGAQAIHPGYGFLSENADFAENCAQAGLIFIGPPPTAIRAMGSKSAAKKIMQQAGVPLVPGYHEDSQDLKILAKAAEKIGYPILIKASAGGGGKGMRIVSEANQLEQAVLGAKREALTNFGNDQVLLEKYLIKPRHVEMQIFADQHGHVIHLFERDCSIQRRHQKIIEEAPAPFMSEKIRKKMGEAAINAAKSIGYIGAGTVEFLLDQDGSFYFMEMNTRLQVEHPVTEMITQQDLVEWQLKIAIGEELPLEQQQLAIHGHAFEARIYAEDPQNNFLPSIGTIQHLIAPKETTETRIDTGVIAGDTISHYYDPMIAKLIVWGGNRAQALARLQNSLAEYLIIGITNNIDLLAAIAKHKSFVAGNVETNFIDNHHEDLFSKPKLPSEVVCGASLYLLLSQRNKPNNDPYSPWFLGDNWHLNLAPQQTFHFTYDNQLFTVKMTHEDDKIYQFKINNHVYKINSFLQDLNILNIEINHQAYKMHITQDNLDLYISCNNERFKISFNTNDTSQSQYEGNHKHKTRLTSPMPGKIVALLVKGGTYVTAGTDLAIIEAMKMEHTIHASSNGTVKEWYFKVDDLVSEGVELLAFEESE